MLQKLETAQRNKLAKARGISPEGNVSHQQKHKRLFVGCLQFANHKLSKPTKQTSFNVCFLLRKV